MSDTKQFFKVENENGEIKDAELLNIFSKDDIEYAVYSIDNGDDTSNLYASRIIINENGSIINIENYPIFIIEPSFWAVQFFV